MWPHRFRPALPHVVPLPGCTPGSPAQQARPVLELARLVLAHRPARLELAHLEPELLERVPAAQHHPAFVAQPRPVPAVQRRQELLRCPALALASQGLASLGPFSLASAPVSQALASVLASQARPTQMVPASVQVSSAPASAGLVSAFPALALASVPVLVSPDLALGSAWLTQTALALALASQGLASELVEASVSALVLASVPVLVSPEPASASALVSAQVRVPVW